MEEGGAVDALTWNPTAGDWTLRVPCDNRNIDWVKTALGSISPRIKVFDVAETDRAEEENNVAVQKGGDELIVDWDLRG